MSKSYKSIIARFPQENVSVVFGYMCVFVLYYIILQGIVQPLCVQSSEKTLGLLVLFVFNHVLFGYNPIVNLFLNYYVHLLTKKAVK